ncbi:MAG TPA: 5-formyltetrahydrofolate cyclo-ligase [Clostridiales bacterium]|nr:5-formyltetrahydrofolate cyclo-ligase [Clostridiales bacterium]
MERNEFRIRALKAREALPDIYVQKGVQNMEPDFLKQPAVKTAQRVMGYMPVRKEVPVKGILTELLSMGASVCFPVVISDVQMEAYPVDSLEAPCFRPGRYGIPEPLTTGRTPLDPATLDLILVPGVAFSYDGTRLGYGAGYYDRFMKRLSSHCLRVGLAFECQVVPEIPAMPYDIPVDLILTEKRLIPVSGISGRIV